MGSHLRFCFILCTLYRGVLFLNIGSAVYNLLRPSAQWSGVRNDRLG